jgi:hypothetical protein
MVNQEQHAANTVPNRSQRPQISDDSHAAPVHPYNNALGIQLGLPANAGNENQGTPNNPPDSNQRHGVDNHPRPAPDLNPVQTVTSPEFLTTPFPPMEHRLFTIEKKISSAEWVSANTGLLQEMRRRNIYDVPFRAEVRHRISPDLWPIIPLEIRGQISTWLTPSQNATLTRMLPCNFQTEITIVEEHTLPPHSHELQLRKIEEAIPNLPEMFSVEATRIKLEINSMFAHHRDWMQKNRGARRWLVQKKDQLRSRTIARWINSWSGRRNGIRPPINPDGRIDA